MNYSSMEKEQVLSLWQDETQSSKEIAERLDLPKEKVEKILFDLEKEGHISDFFIKQEKIVFLSEMLDPEITKKLNLDKLSRGMSNIDYFFTQKNLNKNYEFGPFEIFVESVNFQQGYLILPIKITCEQITHDMFIVYDSNENIHYGSKSGEDGIIRIEQLLGFRRFKMLDEVTSEIIDDVIPEDFWEVRGYSN